MGFVKIQVYIDAKYIFISKKYNGRNWNSDDRRQNTKDIRKRTEFETIFICKLLMRL